MPRPSAMNQDDLIDLLTQCHVELEADLIEGDEELREAREHIALLSGRIIDLERQLQPADGQRPRARREEDATCLEKVVFAVVALSLTVLGLWITVMILDVLAN